MFKTVKAQAVRLYKECRLGLISLSFVLTIFVAGLISIGSSIISHTDGIMRVIVSYILLFLFNVALAPMLVGSYEWIQQLYVGKMRPMKNAFCAFTDIAELIRSQKIFLTYSFILRIALIPVVASLWIVSYTSSPNTSDVLIIALAFMLSLRLLCGGFLLIHILINASHIPTLKAIRLSFMAMKANFRDFCRLISVHALLTAISIASFGVLFVLTLPYIFCSAVVFCDIVYEENELYKYNLFY